jgi:hypothetical protein
MIPSATDIFHLMIFNQLLDGLRRLDVGNVAGVSKIKAASVFRVQLCSVGVLMHI